MRQICARHEKFYHYMKNFIISNCLKLFQICSNCFKTVSKLCHFLLQKCFNTVSKLSHLLRHCPRYCENVTFGTKWIFDVIERFFELVIKIIIHSITQNYHSNITYIMPVKNVSNPKFSSKKHRKFSIKP